LLVAVDYRTGKVLWESPNPRGWTMTHVSIMPMDFAGQRMYVYCGNGGVAGVSAADGRILWDTCDWRIATATCPSPVILGDGRIFLSGGYNAGAMMLQIREHGGTLEALTLLSLPPRRFSSEQQTPILWDGHLYGVRQQDQKLVCLDLQGNELWSSGRDKFGAAPYLAADGLLFAMNDEGLLRMLEATPAGYKPLDQAQVIAKGVTSWGPMALAGGRLIVRDLTRVVCLDVAEEGSP
jgi:outer membrane protein assembly factor BamB